MGAIWSSQERQIINQPPNANDATTGARVARREWLGQPSTSPASSRGPNGPRLASFSQSRSPFPPVPKACLAIPESARYYASGTASQPASPSPSSQVYYLPTSLQVTMGCAQSTAAKDPAETAVAETTPAEGAAPEAATTEETKPEEAAATEEKPVEVAATEEPAKEEAAATEEPAKEEPAKEEAPKEEAAPVAAEPEKKEEVVAEPVKAEEPKVEAAVVAEPEKKDTPAA
ncbi:hypothetical protein BBJ28_00016143 [Nothophytophthora sp. Chile5]|nr:hypothetical protein BBJ28_00016143 [Nothophytophthora sp. Chile5]